MSIYLHSLFQTQWQLFLVRGCQDQRSRCKTEDAMNRICLVLVQYRATNLQPKSRRRTNSTFMWDGSGGTYLVFFIVRTIIYFIHKPNLTKKLASFKHQMPGSPLMAH